MTAAVQACPVSGPRGGELVMVKCSFQTGNPPAGRLAGQWTWWEKAKAGRRLGGSACGWGRSDGVDHARGGECRADPAVQVVAGVVHGAGPADGQPCLVLGQARVVEVGVVVADKETGGETVTGAQCGDPGLMLPAVPRVDHDRAAGAAGGDLAERMTGLLTIAIGAAVVDGDDGRFQGDGVDLLVPGRRMQAVQAAFQPVLRRPAGVPGRA